ncbi:ATP-dependent zinc metalloprotease FtsH [Mycoplasma parvum]|uniref:ATP-dependent zinc metalloprotease FtsH n=1 Tax=Mycoplasma parvum str. Indiana TaxID=1403316 RepID=U5NCT8_9MOLU|nr:ATP-dependent zinc metalloprotease FtsH [Mycoplasma parvum]AGX89341.1 hypothetical protein PRV_03080 [Mycoplasma parvum str. Indiana]
MFFWKILYWLNFFPKFFEDEDSFPYEPDEENALSKLKKFRNSLSPGNMNPRRKSRLMKFIFIAITILVIYFIWFHNRVSHKSKIDFCKNGSTNGKFQIDGEEIDTSAPDQNYSERLARISDSETLFKVFLKTKKGGTISFNVNRSSSNGNSNGKKIYSFNGKDGYNCKIEAETSKITGCCTEKNGECKCCEKGCSEECCKKEGCKCNGDGKCCCCCCFVQLVESAILNPTDPNKLTTGKVLLSVLPTLLYLLVFLALAKGASRGAFGLYGGKSSIFGIGKSISKRNKSNITFKDVAGIKEEKQELEEIVDFLKRPKKYASMGARIPKGVILYGPPGTGKTLLAKAVSGESNVPFIEASGASFDDMFVGVGAKRVRELFSKAKRMSPCIIFIDEIDALAARRGGKYNMQGNEQTINQLLSEMDGFNTQAGIIVIAATNRLESIDEAVLRPGRFDRHIQINLPDISERREILKLHAKNKNLSNKVNLEEMARKTPGFSGAQLENVLNEAALLSVRFNKKTISTEEIDEAIDRVMAGPAKKGRKILFSEKKQIAYHEAGHAIAGLYTDDGELVEKITIIPRGRAAGYVLSVPKVQERMISTKTQLLSTILTMLAGRAAEELFFGKDNISTGAANDLYKATGIARNIVLKFGMTEAAGMTQFIPSEENENPYKNNYSEQYAQVIDREINSILAEQYENAKELIKENKIEFLLIVETLLLLETIDRTQIEFIHKYKKVPKEAELERSRIEKKAGLKIDEVLTFK